MPIQSDIIQPFPKGIAMIEFFLIDILFLFFAILLIVKRNTVFGKDYDVLSLNCSLKIRGALAILIVLHHLSLTIRYTILFKVFTLIGAPCVAIFFFYSGFGLMTNYVVRENYLKAFVSKRILKILIPYVLSFFITWLGYLLTKYKYTPREVINSLFDGDPVVRYSWYVLTILIFYTVFYLSCKILKHPKAVLLGIFLGTVIYCIVVTNSFSWGNWTINSCFAFCLGTIMAVYKENLVKFLTPNKKYIFYSLFVLLCCGGVLIFVVLSDERFSFVDMTKYPPIADYMMKKPLSVIAMNIICAVLIVILFWLFKKVKLNEKIFCFLGKISFEIYLYHGLIMYLLRNPLGYCKIDILYLIITFVLTILISFIMHKFGKIVHENCLRMLQWIKIHSRKIKNSTDENRSCMRREKV